MSQPKWKCVANLGDANPLDYGGLFVYVDETGVYPPEMERLEIPEMECLEIDDEDAERPTYTAWRVCLDQCTFIDGILSDNPYHPAHCAWFATTPEKMKERPQDGRGLAAVADCMGREESEMIADLCSSDPIRLASAWREILDYHGWENGDSYPIHLNRSEARKRYPESEWRHRQ